MNTANYLSGVVGAVICLEWLKRLTGEELKTMSKQNSGKFLDMKEKYSRD